MEERVPPQNIEAEQSVLGAMLIDKEAIAKATEILSAEDFYREAHRVIFSAMLEIYNKNEAVDMITVTDILRRDNKLEDVGGIAYITSLANVVLTAANVKYHAEIVAEKSVRMQRICSRDGIAPEAAEARINAQLNEEYFRKNSDYIIENNKCIEKIETRTNFRNCNG